MGVKSDRNINFSRNEDRIRRTKNYYELKGKQSELHTTPDGLHQVSADLNPTPPDVSLITPNQSRDISEETSLTTKQHARQIEYFESKIQHL